MKPFLLFFGFLFSISILHAQNPVWINHSADTSATTFVSDQIKIMGIANVKVASGGSCPDTPTVIYAGKTYNTVQIGTQCWLKENLDVGTMITSNVGSDYQTDNGTIEKYCYDNNAANCQIYGGLYQWNEAMQYGTTEGVQGICPNGWHIPTNAELHTLNSTIYSSGNALKAIGQGTGDGAGSNTSGFSALLAGDRSNYAGSFYGLGYNANFWSSNVYTVNNLSLVNFNDSIQFGYFDKTIGSSVRCIQGAGPIGFIPKLEVPSDGTINTGTSVLFKWQSSHAISYTLQISTDSLFTTNVSTHGVFGELTDTSHKVDALLYSTKYYWHVKAANSFGSNWSTVWSFTTAAFGQIIPCQNTPTVVYAGKTYHTVQLGSQCWLQENLDVGTMINSNSSSDNQTDNGIIEKYCYANNAANCEIYGGLYQWNEAMQYVAGTQGICPNGWHIPTYDDMQTLIKTINNSGNVLKAVGQGTGAGAGTNTSGFSGLLAGYRDYSSSHGNCYQVGTAAYFWSSYEIDATNALTLYLYTDNDNVVSSYGFNKNNAYSVRCVTDDFAVSVKEAQSMELLKTFDLFQNYPNPFNSTTTIKYKVVKPGFVSLKVFNVMGTEVANLVNERKAVGEYLIEWNAEGLNEGIYFCRMQNGSNIEVKKMILQK